MILITGGLGFLGSNLAERLIRQREDILLVARSSTRKHDLHPLVEHARIVFGDLTDIPWIEALLRREHPETIFHFAARLGGAEPIPSEAYDVDINARSTLAMLDAINRMGLPCRFILGSTFWVVGRPDKLPVDETAVCHPLTVYAANKLASEYYCHIYHAVQGLDTIVLRLGSVFGIHEQYNNPHRGILNHLLYMAYKGQPVPIYNGGRFFKDYIYVSDAVTAAETVMSKGSAGECYFAGTGIRTWFYDIGKWLTELTGCRIVDTEPPRSFFLTDTGDFVIDNTKITGLGWQWKVAVHEGLERTLNYYREKNL